MMKLGKLNVNNKRKTRRVDNKKVIKFEDLKVPVNELLVKTLSTGAIEDAKTVYIRESRIRNSLDLSKAYGSDDDSSAGGSARRWMTSERSVGTVNSFGSESSNTTMTTREMVNEISLRANKNLPPPDYVPRMEELTKSQLSWNKKLPRGFNKKHPPVNIIGCMHPLELVLAKADSRTRQRKKALKIRQRACDQRVKQIDESIQLKFTRAERYAAHFELQQRQIQWMRILSICQFLAQVKPIFEFKNKVDGVFGKMMMMVIRIQRMYRTWHIRKLFRQIQKEFLERLSRSDLFFRLQLRSFRKKKSVLRIKTFLNEYKGHHKMNVVVHRYLMGVRKVQAVFRSFLKCKYAKIEAVGIVWNRVEIKYIMKKLQDRKAQQKGGKLLSSEDQDSVLNDDKSIVEMKNQAKLWSKIDSKMEEKIVQLRLAGVIKEENEEENARKLMLPVEVRNKIIDGIIIGVRNEFFALQRAALRRRIDLDSTFKANHAADLLSGRVEDINRIILQKFDKKATALKYQPLYFFSTKLNFKMISDSIRQAHRQHETFRIKIDETLGTGDAKLIRMLSKKKSILNSSSSSLYG